MVNVNHMNNILLYNHKMTKYNIKVIICTHNMYKCIIQLLTDS